MQRKIGFFPSNWKRSSNRFLKHLPVCVLYLLCKAGVLAYVSEWKDEPWAVFRMPVFVIQGTNWQLLVERWGLDSYREGSLTVRQFGPFTLQTGMWVPDHCWDYEAI